jgi:hypothetical protein
MLHMSRERERGPCCSVGARFGLAGTQRQNLLLYVVEHRIGVFVVA